MVKIVISLSFCYFYSFCLGFFRGFFDYVAPFAHCPIFEYFNLSIILYYIVQVMDFILAHSRYKRRRFEQAIEICDQLLGKNNKDQAAWILKCQCLIKDNYVDELETQEQAMADMLLQDNQKNNLARVGTSFKNTTSHNPVLRPMSNGRISTGFQRAGTSLGSRGGSKAGNMLRTGRIMTKNGVPATSNGRVLRLATASLQQHGQNFFDVSKADLKSIAARRSKSRIIFQYLFYVEHNLRKALQLAVHATQINRFQDPWWKLALAKCYYHLSFLPESQRQFLSSLTHTHSIQPILYLSHLYKKLDNPQKSLSTLSSSLAVHPFQPKLQIHLARLYSDLGQMDKSHSHYQQALCLQNCNIQAVASIASNFFYKQQAEISIKFYQRLLELGYNSPEIWINLAICCFSVGQWPVIYRCLERALELAEQEEQVEILADLWYNIGCMYVQMGDVAMARQAYTNALGYVPDHTEVLNNLAVISAREGKTDWAINYAQKSYRALANFQASYNLSLWYYNSLQYEKAHFYNEQTLKIYPLHTQSKILSQRLQQKLQFL